MVDVEKLKDEMYHKKVSNREMAQRLKMTPKTFYLRCRAKRFYSDEMDCMVEVLHLSHAKAIEIFFAPKVTDTQQKDKIRKAGRKGN